MKRDYLEEYEKFALNNCKILYKDLHKPCTETCMCWGWEFQSGWNEVVKELSVKLEMLNILFYKKYGVHVVMDQCKEKYGTLHAYYHVAIESPFIYRVWHKPFKALYYWMMHNINYSMKTVIDEPCHETIEREEIPFENVKDEKKRCKTISNVKIEKSDGKWYKVYTLTHCQRSHYEPTKHKFLNKIQKLALKLSVLLDFHKKPNSEQLVIRDAVESIASGYVKDAEDKCYNVCEDCGTQIGTEWSPRIETEGWISYICDECDSKRKIHYARNYIEHEMKTDQSVISDKDMSEFKHIVEMVESDKYFDSEEYKKAVKSIGLIADRIAKKNKKNKNNENKKTSNNKVDKRKKN